MESHGILSRYMRPGYARGAYIQEKKVGDKLDKEFEMKKRNFFTDDLDGQNYNESGKNPVNALFYWDEDDQDWYYEEDSTKLDLDKINNQDQWIFRLNDEGSYAPLPFDNIMQETDFLFYDDRKDYQAEKKKQQYQGYYDTAKGLAYLGKNYIRGQDLKDDVSWADTLKEYGKATGRTFLGGAKVLPEAVASIYRFVNPFETLGGVGPIDSFTKDDYKLEDEYYIPYYSDFLGGKDKAGQGVFPEWLKSDNSLYKTGEFDEMIAEANSDDDPTNDLLTRDKFSEQLGAVGLGNALTLVGGLTGPARNTSKLLHLNRLNQAINNSPNLKRLDNPINQLGAAVGLDLVQDQLPAKNRN
tara:strand:- start:7 stop:1074 length:1068 start_codon:yes stop_codon:yes gene_type:complete